MKIIFLCGSLEPGRDGVGDYVLRLAGELIKQKNQVVAIALNDRYTSIELIENKISNNIELKVIRLPAIWKTEQRFSRAQKCIQEFNPDWLSLQFVPFSFHNKGIIAGLDQHLLKLGDHTQWHIMFHELWVGINHSNSFKQYLLGQIQKIFIERLVKRLRPSCVTTSIPVYKKNISSLYVSILPLFGNIPILPIPSTIDTSESKKMSFTVVLFGSITGNLDELKSQINFVKIIASAKEKTVNMVFIGNGGPFKPDAVRISKEILGAGSVTELGQLSFSDVSASFLKADIGISRADYEMFGKSGSTLAMLEHGLPVLLRGQRPGDTSSLENDLFNYRQQIFFCKDDINQLPTKRLSNYTSLPTIASLFTQTLKQSAVNFNN